jgi:hypothetical protein
VAARPFAVAVATRHVASKDDVLDGILDLVLAEGEPPSLDGEWVAAVGHSAGLTTTSARSSSAST